VFSALRSGGDLVISEPVGDSRVLDLLRQSALATGAHPFPGRRIRHPTTAGWIAAAQGVGFRTVRLVPLGYLAFPLLGFPEAIPLVLHVPYRMALARGLVRLDRIIGRVPYLNTWSWQAVFHFRKPPA
jgi:hypothetical protein